MGLLIAFGVWFALIFILALIGDPHDREPDKKMSRIGQEAETLLRFFAFHILLGIVILMGIGLLIGVIDMFVSR